MNEENINKFIGKRCLLILNNEFKYTCIIPKPINGNISILTKFHEEVDICIDFIKTISEIKEKKQCLE